MAAMPYQGACVASVQFGATAIRSRKTNQMQTNIAIEHSALNPDRIHPVIVNFLYPSVKSNKRKRGFRCDEEFCRLSRCEGLTILLL